MTMFLDFLDVDQAADLLRVKRTTIYTWVHQRRIPFRKHGRRLAFAKAELEAWSDAQAVCAWEGDSTRMGVGGISESVDRSLKTRRTAASEPGSITKEN